MEESIYNMIPKELSQSQRPKRYRSRYPSNIPPTGSTFGISTTSKPPVRNAGGHFEEIEDLHPSIQKYSTFGRPEGSLRQSPDKYLKKGQGVSIFQLPRIGHSKSQPDLSKFETTKPPLPKELTPLIRGPKKNYVQENLIANLISTPPKQREEYDWRTKREYGKSPDYLTKRKNEILQESKLLQNAYLSHQSEKKQMQGFLKSFVVPQEELNELRSALKQKYDSVFKEFQKMTYLTKLETLHKKRKFEKCEKDLSQLESDMEKLNKEYIYVDPTMQ